MILTIINGEMEYTIPVQSIETLTLKKTENIVKIILANGGKGEYEFKNLHDAMNIRHKIRNYMSNAELAAHYPDYIGMQELDITGLVVC